ECILLNYTMIKKYRSINDCQSEVTFYDQTSITIDVNIRIIRKQMNRVKSFLNDYQNVHFNQDAYAIIG
ncbi:MAG: competence protein ComK, partial [Erysipelotrichaceae bacterium]